MYHILIQEKLKNYKIKAVKVTKINIIILEGISSSILIKKM
jgi:hypothetical protein